MNCSSMLHNYKLIMYFSIFSNNTLYSESKYLFVMCLKENCGLNSNYCKIIV